MIPPLNVYISTDHDSHYPVGCCSIAVAMSETQARELLDSELVKHGLKVTASTLKRVDTAIPAATVLLDGDY